MPNTITMKVKRIMLRLVLAAGLSILAAGCTTLPGMTKLRVSVKEGTTFPVHLVEEAGWGNATHPYIVRVSDERLALTYWVAGDGSRRGRSHVAWPAYSDDGGRSWEFGNPYNWISEPDVEMMMSIDEGGEFRGFNLGMFFSPVVLPDGERVVFSRHVVGDSAFSRPYQVIRSLDGGETWYPPEESSVHFPEEIGRPVFAIAESSAVATEDGRILKAAFVRVNMRDKYSTYLFESKDRGRTFSYKSTIATPKDAPWSILGPCEPALTLLPNGELLAIMRTGAGGQKGLSSTTFMLQARSRDGGLTWAYEGIRLPGVMPKLLQMSNGILVVAYGRPGNNLAFSTDGGRTWGAETTITRPDQATSGYMAITEVEPGRLLVVYDLVNSPISRFWLWEPTRVNGLMGVYIDVHQRF